MASDGEHEAENWMLSGKTALVTGSTGTIGYAVARTLAERGCSVMVHGTGDREEIDARCAAMRREYGTAVCYSDADIASPEGVRALVRQTEDELGAIDILVNAAAIQYVAPLEEFPFERLRAILDVNLLASIVATQLVIPGMKLRRWGRIINFASTNGLVSSPFKVPYSVSKHGIVGLTKGTALELGEYGVTCNALAPGFVDTPMFREPSSDLARREGVNVEAFMERLVRQKHVIPRLISPRELAAAVLFYCSDDAAAITGTVLPVDAGWTAH